MSAWTWKTSVIEASNCSAPARAGRLPRPRVHQLGRDPHAARAARLLPAHGAREQVVRAQLVGDLARPLGRVAVLDRAAAGDHLEARDLAELAAHLVAHAVGEVGVARVAQVLEREHGDDAGARSALGARAAVAPGEQQAAADQEAGGEGDGGDRASGGGMRRRAAGRRGHGRRDGGRVRGGTVAAGAVAAGGVACSARGELAAVANRSAATGASARRIASSTASGTFGRTRPHARRRLGEPLGDDRLRGRRR